MANALGIDYGQRRIGLSFADELGVAFPLDPVPGVEEPSCFDALAVVVSERKPDLFVLGYPLNMDGSVGTRAREVDAFAEELERRFALPVEKVDERLRRTRRRAMQIRAVVVGARIAGKWIPSQPP